MESPQRLPATAWDELEAIIANEPADLSRARVVARLAEVASSLLERAALEQRVTDLEASLGDDARHLRAVR